MIPFVIMPIITLQCDPSETTSYRTQQTASVHAEICSISGSVPHEIAVVPESFLRGMKELEGGLGMDFDDALDNPPSDE